MKKIKFHTLFMILLLLFTALPVSAAELLIPGGQVIGLQLTDGTVTVAAFDPQLGKAAQAAGLETGDRIVRIGDRKVSSAADIRTALEKSGGSVELHILRGGKTKKLRVEPAITPEGPRLGVYLKEGVTGIGTVTWYDREGRTFGALGHGVSDAEGQPVQMGEGSVFSAAVVSVQKGKCGDPGQLMGTLTERSPIGTLQKNTLQGVFGKLDRPVTGQVLPTADRDEIHTGPAVIRSTVSGSRLQEYSVEILKIYPSASATGRNMLLKVTDPALLEATGGIVQGMSGSPIIQDGKLIGAVTHVLVNDPTTGYGIFVENMLDAAA